MEPETISIHTLRMEGDLAAGITTREDIISIHTLRMEGDIVVIPLCPAIGFISIHTLRMEGDHIVYIKNPSESIFQSTPSAWRVTLATQVAPGTAQFQSTPSAWRVTAPNHNQ